MRMAKLSGVCCAIVFATATTAAAQQPDDALEQLLTRATWHSLDFVDKLSNVVAEERYVQDSSVALATVPIPGLGGRGNGVQSSIPRGSAKHRELKSDFLIVKSNGPMWEPFRDVFEVDHIPVRDRDERISRLFLNPTGDTEARARAIAEESARYNLGAVRRTINNPVFALIFLQPDLRWHFRFTLGKPDRRSGDDVRVVEYLEEARPTIITGLPGQEMVAYGRFWIEAATGRVLKTEVRVDERGVKAVLTTVFKADERLGIDVPVEMREDYELADGHVSGSATYGRFRRFEVNAREELSPPDAAAPPPPSQPAPSPSPQ
jgi:hypothetical protein